MVKRHKRRDDAAAEYRIPTALGRKDIQPDAVGPSVMGVYLLPGIWVGDDSIAEGTYVRPTGDPATLALRCGIEFRCTTDGLFAYDFHRYPPARQIFIPGYHKILDDHIRQAPIETERAEQLVRDYNRKRVGIINAHKFLLWSTVSLHGKAMDWPVPLNENDAMHGHSIDGCLSPSMAISTGRYHTQVHLVSEALKSPGAIPRRTISFEHVVESLETLDKVLECDERDILIVEEIYFALYHEFNRRFGIALIGIWAVIEHLIGQIWSKKMIPSAGKRREKLKSLEFTSSIKIESLFMAGHINSATYEVLEAARGARNKWVHSLKIPSDADMNAAKQALVDLMSESKGIKLQVPRGFGAAYSYSWIWNDPRAFDTF